MRILGIETSGDVCGVAIVDGDGLLGEMRFRHGMHLSERLIPGIEALREQAGMLLGDLEGIAVSTGPGSFTGLRIGLTTAKTLAWALGIPVAGVGTLRALAGGFPAPPGTRVCAFLPAGGSGLFGACYLWEGEELVETRAPEVLSNERIPELAAEMEKPAGFIGLPPAQRAAVAAAMGAGAWFIEPAGAAARPGVVAALGRRRLEAGERDDVETLAPLYARPSTAEARRLEALGQG